MKKTILITGSTDGIGKLAAIKLAKDGHEIFLHGRNAQKLETVISEVKAQTNNPYIKGFVADFSDLAAVQQMAAQANKELSKIDVLINNAVIFKSPVTTNNDGLDIRFVVNYLAPYVLTKTLLPLLQKGTAPRLINLSSAAQAPVSHDALAGKIQVGEQSAYAQSKLALTMWSFQLAKQLEDIAVVAVNPGSLLNTNMVKEAYGKYWSSADKGGNIIYDLAISAEYEGITGTYFDNDRGEIKGTFGPAHSNAYDEDAIKKLLQATDLLLNR